MRRVTLSATIVAIMTMSLQFGCSVSQPTIPDSLEYREIPEAYLQECVLPKVPLSNGNLSDAFAQAYQCGEQGNKDKRRIRALSKVPENLT